VKSKYRWVAVNLALSLANLLFMDSMVIDINTGDITPATSLLALVFVLSPLYWFYRTMQYWRQCVEADDTNLSQYIQFTRNPIQNGQ
jgi:protein-S-isoprenylcysteine O-methyltransferase Ste14